MTPDDAAGRPRERGSCSSLLPPTDQADGGSAGRSGGRDCDETECDQAPMRSLPARPAPSGAPPGGRQINSKDTQTSGSVKSKSQAAGRQAEVSQSSASPTDPIDPAIPASSSASVNARDVYWADSTGRRNTPISRGVTMGRTAAWMSTKTGRAPMRSPGRPPPRREVERAFWAKIAEG